MATFTGTPGTDTFYGTADPDIFNFRIEDVSSSDVVYGSSDDTLHFLDSGALSFASLKNFHIGRIELADGTNNIEYYSVDPITIVGGLGTNTVTDVGRYVHFISTGGVDFFTGGDNSVFEFNVATLDQHDHLKDQGEPGTLLLNGTGSVSALDLSGVVNVSNIVLQNGGINLTLDPIFAAGFSQSFYGGITITGSSGNDSIDARQVISNGRPFVFDPGSGDDTIYGGSDNNYYYFDPADLTAADTIVGGPGNDTIRLRAAGTPNLGGVTGVEEIDALDNTRLILTKAMGDTAVGRTITVKYGDRDTSDWIDASAMTGATLDVRTGASTYHFVSGVGTDTNHFTVQTINASDVITGAGHDQLIITQIFPISASDLVGISGVSSLSLNTSIELSDAVAEANAPVLSILTGKDVDAHAVTDAGRAISVQMVTNGGGYYLGGAGADNFFYRAGNNVDGGGGSSIDTITFYSGYAHSTFSDFSTITGIEKLLLTGGMTVDLNDTLVDTAYNQTLYAVAAAAGGDVVDGSAITDPTHRLDLSVAAGTAGQGNTLIGGAGDDNITGGAGNDTLTGGVGNDVLNGGLGADAMAGGDGNDTYMVDNVRDTVTEAAGGGTDLVRSTVSYALSDNVERLTLDGTGNTIATGNALDNILTGNSGNNTLNGLAGADIMSGGAGNDTYYVDNVGDRVIEAANGGTDLVHSTVSFALSDNVERLTLDGTGNTIATGNALDNVLTGNSGNNTLIGGLGADFMIGGAGNDTYYVDNTGDVVSEAADGGIDLVHSTISFALGANVERLTLDGTGNTIATGNALDNILTGNSGNNVLDGKGGIDTLTGGGGNDTFLFDTALGGGALGNIADFSVGTDLIKLDHTIFAAAGAVGALSAAAFTTGTAATDADQRIVYDSATGDIFYDPDGNGAAAQVKFAHVTAGTALGAGSFTVG